MLKAFLAKLLALFKVMPLVNPPVEPQNPIPVQAPLTTQQRVYLAAKGALGKHITLNDNVPHDVGCAEAVSYVLKAAGLEIPAGGFAGTYDLWQWLKVHATPVTIPYAGCCIISPTGTSTINSPHGHTGVVAKFGILSNNSDSGLFTELWTIEKWNEYYHDRLQFPVYYYSFA